MKSSFNHALKAKIAELLVPTFRTDPEAEGFGGSSHIIMVGVGSAVLNDWLPKGLSAEGCNTTKVRVWMLGRPSQTRGRLSKAPAPSKSQDLQTTAGCVRAACRVQLSTSRQVDRCQTVDFFCDISTWPPKSSP